MFITKLMLILVEILLAEPLFIATQSETKNNPKEQTKKLSISGGDSRSGGGQNSQVHYTRFCIIYT